MLVKVNQYQL